MTIWLRKTTPVSIFLQDKLKHPPRFKLISSGYSKNQDSFYRETIIYNNTTPLIYAQTHFPHELAKTTPKLVQLGESSLGIFLLKNKQFHKDKMDFGYLKQIDLLPEEITNNPEIKKCDLLLCRRSILSIAEHKAVLVEVFLPGFKKIAL